MPSNIQRVVLPMSKLWSLSEIHSINEINGGPFILQKIKRMHISALNSKAKLEVLMESKKLILLENDKISVCSWFHYSSIIIRKNELPSKIIFLVISLRSSNTYALYNFFKVAKPANIRTISEISTSLYCIHFSQITISSIFS